MKRFLTKRNIIIAVILLAAVGGFFIYRAVSKQAAAASATSFQTAQIQRGSLTAMVGATGTVHANQTAVLNWQTSGTISNVNTRLGSQTTAGQVLVELNPTSLPQSVILAQADLVAALRNLDTVKNSDVVRTQAQLDLAKAEKAYDDAKTKRESKRYQRASQSTVDTARANLILAEDELTKSQDIFDQNQNRDHSDPIYAAALSRLAAAEQQRDNAEANLRYALELPDSYEVAEADANLALAKAQLADAQQEWERLKDGPDPDDVAAAEAKVAAIQATIDNMKIKAPFAGTITALDSKVGDQVSLGASAVRIDDLDHLLVDVQVPEVDINRIQKNMPASLTFDAIIGQTYNGVVIEVGQVGTPVQGVVNFTVTVEVTDADENVRPGMTSAVNIIVSQLDNILLIPNRAVRSREGQRIVYLLKNNVLTPVDITLGASSDTDSELVTGDISEGDLVVLNPPANLQGPFMMGPMN